MAKLFIVGTPIGNLADITLRALDTLKSVPVIACEDTRHSLPMLQKYGVNARLVAYHKFNERSAADDIVAIIESGQDVALISDAGMPTVCDPGAILIERCRQCGVEVELVPGPTAAMSAVALSGMSAQGFVFVGFLPEKNAERRNLLSKADAAGLPIVMYVAPHDLVKTAQLLLDTLGDRTVRVCRELTKVHESVTVCALSNFECETRGEIVLIVDAAPASNPLCDLTVEDHLRHYLAAGLDKKEAVKRTAADRSLPKNEVYQISLTLK